MKAADYYDIGRYLKDIRESQHISQSQAAHAMHIRVHYVEAIEKGEFSVLPGKAYVRGYLKNYALYLGINPDETIEAYDALSATAKREYFVPEPAVAENLPSRALLFILLFAGLFVVGYYLLLPEKGNNVTPTVADVPANLIIAAETAKSSHNFEWIECLKGDVDECFNERFAADFLAELDKGYRTAFQLISPH